MAVLMGRLNLRGEGLGYTGRGRLGLTDPPQLVNMELLIVPFGCSEWQVGPFILSFCVSRDYKVVIKLFWRFQVIRAGS